MPQIPHCELTDLKEIGQGGFGIVYQAKHPRHGTVVYKELNARILGDRYSKHLFYSNSINFAFPSRAVIVIFLLVDRSIGVKRMKK